MSLNLLDTFLGKHTGERVLDGKIRRGDGDNIRALIWFFDLRKSSTLAQSMQRHDFLGLLNSFYDCLAGAVLDNGGEVLRFIGDAALAIFHWMRNLAIVRMRTLVSIVTRVSAHWRRCVMHVRALRRSTQNVLRAGASRLATALVYTRGS
jgi:class 3 adenylate cyclase